MLFTFGYPYQSQHSFFKQSYQSTNTHGNYGHSYKISNTLNMKAEIDGQSDFVERADMMNPPSITQKPNVTSPGSFSTRAPMDNGGQRRQSRFDPMGSDADEEGYGDMGQKHNFKKIVEEAKRETFNLPGIKSLLNPSNDREASSSKSGYQSSLPSLISTSPSDSPSTLRSSRWSSLASSSSGEGQGGWWNQTQYHERPPFSTQSSMSRTSPLPPGLNLNDDHDAKRRRSDLSPSMRDHDEQNRLRWLAQSRNASFPISNNSAPMSRSSSDYNDSRMMHPPAPPNARGSVSQQDPLDRRPSGASRQLSLVSGPLSRSFADLSATEKEKERERERQGSISTSNEMRPPLHTPPAGSRSATLSVAEIQSQREHTATPPESSRANTMPPAPGSPRVQQQRTSLSDLIRSQSGDGPSMQAQPSRPDFRLGRPSLSEPGWYDSRRSSGSSTHSNSTPTSSNTIGLRMEDGRQRPYHPAMMHPAGGDSMSGMDMLAESARRISEEDEYRRSGPGRMAENRSVSPRPGNTGPKYQCSFCTKVFSRPSSLRIHTHSHTGERPYVCQEPTCRRRFSVQSNLKRHAKVHIIGTAGGASLHQLHSSSAPHHNGTIPHQNGNGHGHPHGPMPGQSYFAPGAYSFDGRYPPNQTPGPYAQPHPSQRYYPETRSEEEDELEESEEEGMEEEVA